MKKNTITFLLTSIIILAIALFVFAHTTPSRGLRIHFLTHGITTPTGDFTVTRGSHFDKHDPAVLALKPNEALYQVDPPAAEAATGATDLVTYKITKRYGLYFAEYFGEITTLPKD